MPKRITRLASLLATSLALPFVASAHHSFAAEFDVNKVVHLEGTVVKFAWVNPHSWLHINVKNADGTEVEWKIEGGAPSALLRRGWNRNSLPMGTKVIVNAFQARDGALRASARDIVFPDGRKLDLASSYQTSRKDEKDDKDGKESPTP
jgi:hypothetical protein